MSDKYEPSKVEDSFYKIWEERGYFEIDGNKSIQKDGKNFSIMMPPPNVTGSLHIGHALTFTLQDIITRYKRMDGFKTLWQPGTDHAGIATQNIVEKQLLAEGTTKEKIGREKFLERAWIQKKSSSGNIVHQMRKLGVSPAWSRERFTMDEGLKEAVKEAFIKLYNDGLITQNNYMVNWCTHDGALSDIEVEHEEINGNFYHMNYNFADGSGFVTLATTRPETYFGDSAVMVHPDDERYKSIIGKELVLPLINRKIKIIADSHVDMEFGTGIVKVTPAHDTNDYEVGLRHNLEFIKCFDEKGILNNECGEFAGLERLEARAIIVKKLQEDGIITKIEEHKHQVGHCYRCKNIVEPFISKQWFLSEKVAKKSIEKTKAHNNFHPAHWINSYTAWMDELRPWCISRQLWWGHRIPVFTCNSCNHEWADKNDVPEACPKCNNKNYVQDPDVLDTWFSSALWAFSPLGWGNNEKSSELYNFKEDMKNFYPNSLLITGFDIMFFWVARMMMMGEYLLGELPFKDIYMHALVRDETGAKMSKSKGNVIDPLDMVEEHSADIIRFTLAYLAVQGRDIKLGAKNLEQFRNFTNKLYNASNFLTLNVDTFPDLKDINIETPLGLYMQSKLSKAVEEVRTTLESYKFNEAASTLYRFVWMEFCDWGIEYSKASKDSIVELGAIFKETLKMVSPFMPFISDYLYHKLSGTTLENGDSLMIMNFPKDIKKDEKIEEMFAIIEEAIISIRRAKVIIDMGNSKISKAYIKLDKLIDTNIAKPFIEKLAKVEDIEFVDKKVENSITDVSNHLEVYLPTKEIDMKPIIDKLEKQKEKAQKEFDKLNGMLSNERFVANAPANVIEENKKALDEVKTRLEKIEAELKSLS
ncbi:valine--tRNA ligase [Aliarcobacter thereius]|uniref:Valine--tRNA ligase n=2 Tax=Aliarcobacter thereius TaxID=544718 RepID=A0A1C0B5X4_9BACT|nr:valine--tRNA ligase [Aliarcobacter thereius]OCL89813.1 Valine--tRNA ligase [Aliarcobacter thereius]OCL96463.1 Valine--tRNA ligase [Aliarcobacter thereius LMG 24486]OCL98577.1 Valine--tRNA ligase [Aliarcobacter thereius]QBF15576.1 valyl-tRNA synthetase [Aliarcobacter thereius LMG 24486]TLS71563.1 valine--tRNA ligase [Aliarcobacter thereius]